MPPLPQPHLEQRLRARGDPQLAAPRALGREQLGAVGVRGDRDRPRVRHRHRHRAQAHHPGDVEPLDHAAHRAGEGLPAVVGLGAVEQQVRRAAGVGEQPDDEPRGVVALVVVADERHRRSAGAVVVELVDVEGRHHAAVGAEVDEVLGGAGGGAAGVEEPVEHQHQGQRAVGPSRRPGRRARARRRRCAPAGIPWTRGPSSRGMRWMGLPGDEPRNGAQYSRSGAAAVERRAGRHGLRAGVTTATGDRVPPVVTAR